MDLKRTKQLIYGTFYLIIWLGVFAAIYFMFFNSGPKIVPCGSACIPANLDTISPLATPQIFVSSPGHYTILAQVENTNSGFAAESFDYEFDLYDASNTLIGSVPGQSFMYGAETKYLLAPNLTVASGTADYAKIVLSNIDWVPAATTGLIPQFMVQNLGSGPATSSTISVNGELTDNDLSAFTNILIIGIFKDANGDPLGASQTEIDSISPNQTENFSVMYPASAAIAPAFTTFYAYALRI